MNSSAYYTLKKALKTGDFNKLPSIKSDCNHIFSEQVDYMLQTVNLDTPFNISQFINLNFSKDELVVTFLLYLGKLLNIVKIQHVMYFPYTDSIFYWHTIYKCAVYSIVTLLYNKSWSSEELFLLEEMVLEMNTGNPKAVRTFLNKLLNKELPIYDAEKNFIQTRRMSSEFFGPFYWRLLHLMAEAMEIRKQTYPKKLWREFVVYVLPQTLRCSICEKHYETIVNKYSKDLWESDKYVDLWFKIHNEVNVNTGKTIFAESEFKKEREYLKSLL